VTAPTSEYLQYPAPQDDGAARGLAGKRLPEIELPSTAGGTVDLARASPRFVLYVYPSASCAFRDRRKSFEDLGVTVMGLSAQTTEAQRAFAGRKEINFPLLSDPDLKLSRELGLPTFTAGDLHLYKRLTLVADSDRILKVFYPVFPPDTHPADVLEWVRAHVEPHK